MKMIVVRIVFMVERRVSRFQFEEEKKCKCMRLNERDNVLHLLNYWANLPWLLQRIEKCLI